MCPSKCQGIPNFSPQPGLLSEVQIYIFYYLLNILLECIINNSNMKYQNLNYCSSPQVFSSYMPLHFSWWQTNLTVVIPKVFRISVRDTTRSMALFSRSVQNLTTFLFFDCYHLYLSYYAHVTLLLEGFRMSLFVSTLDLL
ncbi:hypothetical protein HJG60_010256 [Phyllostomus discolor]|uniref:Uncharacterized protein n=1 Tax=Phyllostomus discolor TaxID=89673 RepID=A0A834AY84_9CHIR|nr:hypothetical protein HJG60_010256 [Phyllostomus discolor]